MLNNALLHGLPAFRGTESAKLCGNDEQDERRDEEQKHVGIDRKQARDLSWHSWNSFCL